MDVSKAIMIDSFPMIAWEIVSIPTSSLRIRA